MSHPTLKILGAAIVAAALSTSAMAQTSGTPGATNDGSGPISGKNSNSVDKSVDKSMTPRKHKAEKSHSSKSSDSNMQQMNGGMSGSKTGTSPVDKGATGASGTGSQ